MTEKKGMKNAYCSRKCYSKSEMSPVPHVAIEEYVGGLTLQEVGARHNVSAETIRRTLLRAGIPLRKRSAHLLTDKNPTKGKGHTDATKAKIREANRRQFASEEARQGAADKQRRAMSEGRVSCVSRIEDVVAAELDRRGVPYQRQHGIREPETGRYCACVDFLLGGKLVIEVNGTYWHADPRVYTDGPIHASQRRTDATFKKKQAALDRLGYRIVVIWETEIRQDVKQAVAAALG